MKIPFVGFLLLCSVICVLGQEFRNGQFPSSTTLFGVTYSPFAFDPASFCLPVEQVTIDMGIIGSVADHVRTYGLNSCLENVQSILSYCQQNNMRAIVGLFISGNEQEDIAEVGALRSILDSYGDVIDAIAVGNEALFARRLSVERLIGHINDAKAIVAASLHDVPVTTAEVWPVYESIVGPDLVAALDFICLNMQPFWEGWDIICPPTDSNCLPAGPYVHAKADGLESFFGKPVWVCESGWPTEGERCCQGRANARDGLLAGPSTANATIFLGELVEGGKQINRPTYIHAMFDEDWKRIWAPCGTCEGLSTLIDNPSCNSCELDYHFGIYEFDRTPKSGVTLPGPA